MSTQSYPDDEKNIPISSRYAFKFYLYSHACGDLCDDRMSQLSSKIWVFVERNVYNELLVHQTLTIRKTCQFWQISPRWVQISYPSCARVFELQRFARLTWTDHVTHPHLPSISPTKSSKIDLKILLTYPQFPLLKGMYLKFSVYRTELS